MREKIERMAKGIFEYELPGLELETRRLVICAEAGKTFHGSFRLCNSANRVMKGIVYSDHHLLRCEQDYFSGTECMISYVFHAQTLKAGESFEGNISIVSDAGEVKLPYEVKVILPYLMSSVGEIKDLFQFTALAKQNWKEAELLFFSKEFASTVFYRDKRFYNLYQTLTGTQKHGPAMEEFLIAAGKKTPGRLQLSAESKAFSYPADGRSYTDTIELQMQGWGYTEYRVECEASYVTIKQRCFCTDDFIDRKFTLEFTVNTAGAGKGLHRTEIRITSARAQYAVSVACEAKESGGLPERRKKARLAAVGMMQNYLMYATGKRNAKQYQTEADRYLAVFRTMPDCDEETALLVRLYQAHIWQRAEKDAAAKSVLNSLREVTGMEKIEQYPRTLGAYYYLLTMQKRPECTAEFASGKLRTLYREDTTKGELLWYLLQTDREYHEPKARLEAIRTHMEQGRKEVLLMMEALIILRENASLLRALDRFTLPLLYFGVRIAYLSDELLRQLLYLADKERSMPPLLYNLLSACYEQKKDKQVLEVICTLLIRNGICSKRAFEWFRRGVEEQLRITELEEKYIECMSEDFQGEIPQQVYLYFSYQNRLSDRKRSLLYANLIRNKQRQNTVYQKYRREMEEFAGEQMKSSAFSENLAVIYNDIFHDGMYHNENYEALPRLAFLWKITCNSDCFCRVQVRIQGLERELSAPMIGRKAYINICTEDAAVFLVDADGIYYPIENLDNADFGVVASKQKMLYLDRHLRQSYEAGSDDLLLLLYLEEQLSRYQKNVEYRQEMYRRLSETEDISEERRGEYARRLADYYFENYESELYEYYLKKIDLQALDKKERCETMNRFIMRGFDREAFEALRLYGADGVEIRRIAKLTDRLLGGASGISCDSKEDKALLLYLIYQVFEGGRCKTEQIGYLCRNYRGSTEQLCAVWNAAKNEGIVSEELEENLLAQMLFAESIPSARHTIFKSYYEKGKNHMLVRAYLNYFSYKYLTRGRVLPQELFEIMEREISLEENDICTAALLKHYAEEEYFTERSRKMISMRVAQLLGKGILLPFFRKFEHIVNLPEEMFDHYYVEYCTDPACEVTIHCRMEGEEQFIQQKMKNVLCGIFVTGFVMFAEESLQYYITEKCEERERLTESTTVLCDKPVSEGHSMRYDQINLILAAHQMQEETTVLKLLEQYICMEYETKRLFQPILRN